jgi:hypothetical protein
MQHSPSPIWPPDLRDSLPHRHLRQRCDAPVPAAQERREMGLAGSEADDGPQPRSLVAPARDPGDPPGSTHVFEGVEHPGHLNPWRQAADSLSHRRERHAFVGPASRGHYQEAQAAGSSASIDQLDLAIGHLHGDASGEKGGREANALHQAQDRSGSRAEGFDILTRRRGVRTQAYAGTQHSVDVIGRRRAELITVAVDVERNLDDAQRSGERRLQACAGADDDSDLHAVLVHRGDAGRPRLRDGEVLGSVSHLVIVN